MIEYTNSQLMEAWHECWRWRDGRAWELRVAAACGWAVLRGEAGVEHSAACGVDRGWKYGWGTLARGLHNCI